MEALTRHVKERLRQYDFCRIFENELTRVWPIGPEEKKARARRIEKIKAYAKIHGWSVTIRDPGIIAVFRKDD